MKASTLLSVFITLQTVSALPYEWSWLKNAQSVLSFSSNKPCLIKLGPIEYAVVSEEEKLQLKREKINFIDVTSHISVEEAIQKGSVLKQGEFDSVLQLAISSNDEEPVAAYNYPQKAKHEKNVVPFFKDIDVESMKSNLNNFTSFYTRYYKSKTGFESALWLQGKINEIIPANAVKKGITVTPVDHQEWDQFSLVVTIPGKGYTSTEKGPIVIIGSHQDSVNLLFPNAMPAPGADDNGSGTVTCLEVLRLLAEQYSTGEFAPENTLEFHFYSAEEGGCLGSIDVFTRYKIAGEEVFGMLQQDMTGYTAKVTSEGVENHLGLITDYTTSFLNNFVKLMIDTYCNIPYHESSCGYACSDHSSAISNGFPASFVIESEFKYISGYIHSIRDTVDKIDWDHVVEHVKLTIGFAYELSHAKVIKTKD
ncbi:putative leucine aminopeptidase A [[Candida] railenensis]|uniref:Peptide hydrolase n=1 Tax=[Candida] railenensis TaxID=45579 RepID=A0A9P0QJ99_9ASCO|nr:putative leucine aminopeptidase A [[Candida] railenensis]